MGRKILFITTDQQRYDALGCTGGRIARTPVVDALAARGLVYEGAPFKYKGRCLGSCGEATGGSRAMDAVSSIPSSSHTTASRHCARESPSTTGQPSLHGGTRDRTVALTEGSWDSVAAV